jgi:hypothetical protein
MVFKSILYHISQGFFTQHLADTAFGRHNIWPTQHLADTTFGRHNIWPTQHLADTTFGRHNIWPTLHLADPTLTLLFGRQMLGWHNVSQHFIRPMPLNTKRSNFQGKPIGFKSILYCNS